MTCFNNGTVIPGRRLPAALAFLFVVLSSAQAAPYRPLSDDAVLATVPAGVRAVPAGARSVQAGMGTAQARALNLPGAVAQATADVEMARATGDPRYLGYAQSALRSWWGAKDAPLPVLLLRAQINQHNHSFAPALADLDRALALDPRNAQARLTRAAIYQVQGHYSDAAADCRSLALLVEPLVTADCMSRLSSHRGDAHGAYRRLLALRDRVDAMEPHQRREIELTLADISTRLGNADTARQHYDSALSAAEPDAYTLLTFADFLLDQREYSAVTELYARHPDYADLLLRAALAARAVAAPAHPCAQAELNAHAERTVQAPCPSATNAEQLALRLREQYAAHQRRGDFSPSRDYARFLLDIEGKPAAALDAALANWQTQREPADALIVLRAAIAAKKPAAAEPVASFVRRYRLEDVRLAPLLSHIPAPDRPSASLPPPHSDSVPGASSEHATNQRIPAVERST